MNRGRTVALSITAIAMILLILDTRTAFMATEQVIDICLRAVIPSLFPFLFLSAILNDVLLGTNIRALRPIGRICKIPEGTEALLLLGLIGGYPVGAAAIYNAYINKTLNKSEATRMLSFCNNAGPAFLFGMLYPGFGSNFTICILWLIHILSAVIIGAIMPNTDHHTVTIDHAPAISTTKAMRLSIGNMAVICGWIVLFRIILSFLERWFLWLLPQSVQIFIYGIFELSNGCLSLFDVPCQGMRFLFAAIFLSFGGICVTMQTASVIGDLPIKSYIKGKLLQTAISFLLASIVQPILFPDSYVALELPVIVITASLFFFIIRKKAVAFSEKIRYNTVK